MSPKQSAIVTLSIDVEEEGLFKKSYQCFNPPVENVAYLSELRPFINRGIKPTFFCAHAVLANNKSRSVIESFLPDIELGAHLHHWNTLPLIQNLPANGILKTVPAIQVPLSIMELKLKTLLKLCKEVAGKPVVSFRMGRWDLHASLWPLLISFGIKCDASVRPLHRGKTSMHGPNHFTAPPDPYWLRLPEGKLLEVPLTAVPIKGLGGFLVNILAKKPGWACKFHKWGALALLPVQHPLWLLKLTTLRHLQRGGKVLSLTWHSSEMMPNGTPHLQSQEGITAFLKKMFSYLDWLEEKFAIQYKTVGDLYNMDKAWPAPASEPGQDWIA